MQPLNLIIVKIYMNNRILVIGKNSQLGKSLKKVIKNKSFLSKATNNTNSNLKNFDLSFRNFIFVSRDLIDLSNPNSIKNFFELNKFNVIINFAAYTSVDEAESNIEQAEQINHFAVAQISKIAKDHGIPLIQISTDYVFNGCTSKAYIETDKTNPKNTYGNSKLKGELAIRDSGCNGAIIRTSWLYSEFGNNFVQNMLNLGQKNKSISVINDQIGSPTYASNLSKVLLNMLNDPKIEKILKSELNIYHFSDEGICSWFEFAKTIFEFSKIKCQVNPIKTKDYLPTANRPLYSVMSKDKIKNILPSFKFEHWQDALVNCLKEIKNKDHHQINASK